MSAETTDTTPQQEPVAVTSKEDPNHTSFLEQELRIRTDERENYKNRMKQMEQELEALQRIVAELGGKPDIETPAVENVPVETPAVETPAVESSSVEKHVGTPAVEKPATENAKTEREENAKLRDMVISLRETIREKTFALTRKQLETEALESQVAALKEVTLLTKGMLDIRNTENVQLKEQIDLMQQKIVAERARHNAMIQKTEQAASINNQLKEEYHNQVALFAELKEKYERKVFLLQEEIGRLEALQGTPSATA